MTMNAEAIQCLERIAYALITAMAMEAENKQREHQGNAMAYTESDFLNAAESMRGAVANLVSYVK
jgi:hypothetical protein